MRPNGRTSEFEPGIPYKTYIASTPLRLTFYIFLNSKGLSVGTNGTLV